MARVSVLMSCHGTGRWLKEALDSLPWSMDGLEVWLTANGHDDAPDVARAETPVLIHKLW
jgi:hypothetical protein